MKHPIKKTLSFLLTLMMVVNIFPLTSFAGTETGGTEETLGASPAATVSLTVDTADLPEGEYYILAFLNGEAKAYAPVTASATPLQFYLLSNGNAVTLTPHYTFQVLRKDSSTELPEEDTSPAAIANSQDYDLLAESGVLNGYAFSWSETAENNTFMFTVAEPVMLRSVGSNDNVIVNVTADSIDLSSDGSRYFIVVGSNDDLAPYQWTEISAASPAGEYGFRVENLEQIENDPNRTLFVLLKRYESGENPTPETLDHDVVYNWNMSSSIAVGDTDYDYTWADTGKDLNNRSTYGITITKQSGQGGGGGDEPSEATEHTAIIKLGKGVNLGEKAYVVFYGYYKGTDQGRHGGAVAGIDSASSGTIHTIGSGTTFTNPWNEPKSSTYESGDKTDVVIICYDENNNIQQDNVVAGQLPNSGAIVIQPGDTTCTINGRNYSVGYSIDQPGNKTTIQIGTMPEYTVAINFSEDEQTITPALTGRYYILAGKEEDSFDFYAPVAANGTVGSFAGEGVQDNGKLPAVRCIQIVEYTGSNSNPSLTDLLGAETAWIANGGKLEEYTVTYPTTLEPDNDIITFTAASPKRYTSSISYYENGALQQGSAELGGNYYIVALDGGEPLYYAAVPNYPNPSTLTFRDSDGKASRLTGGLTFEIRKANNGNAPMSEVLSAPVATTLGQYVVTPEYNEGDKTCTFTAVKSSDKFVKVNYYQNGGAETDPSPVLTGDYYMVASVNGKPLYYAKVTTSGENYSFSNGADTLNLLPAGAEIKLVEYVGANANPTLDDLKGLPETTILGKYAWSRDESVTDGFVFKAVASNDIYVRVTTYENDNETPVIPEEAITGQYYVRIPLYGGTDGTEVVGYTIQPFTFDPEREHTDIKITNKFVATTANVFDDSAAALDLTGYTPGLSDARVFRLAGNQQLPTSWAAANDTTTPVIDDTAPAGWAYVNGNEMDNGYNVHLKRAGKPLRYHVRLKFDTTDPSEINLDGGAYLKVTVSHENTGVSYGFIPLSNAVHKKAEYMTVDPDNGYTYIDIPITEWKNENGQILPLEKYTGNEQSVSVTLASGSSAAVPRNVHNLSLHDYLNSFEIEEYPNGSEDNHLAVESANFVDVYDVVTLDHIPERFNGYTLEEILNGYNIVTLCPNKVASPSNSGASAFGDGDFLMKNHCMGGVLIRGDVIHISGTGVADSEYITKPSVVGGYVPSNGDPFFNNRVNNPNPWNGYVGEVNTVVGDYMINGIALQSDGKGYTGTPGTTIATDDYIDWDRLQNMVIDTSSALAAAADEQAYTGTTIDVVAGSNVYIDFPENTVITINIIALDENNQPIQDPNDIPATVISNKGTGTYIPPKLQINGTKLETKEDGKGMSLLWNFPNAKKINLPTAATPEFGHVIAPKAFIDIEGGNYSGCMVGNKVASAGEGHLYPYQGATLIGFYGDLGFEKKVNGAKPTEKQKYNFTLEKLTPNLTNSEYNERMAQLTGDDKEQQVFWQRVMTVQNKTGENQAADTISFEDISFEAAGKYYFRVYENPAVITNTELDSRQFMIEITVATVQDPNDTTKFILQVSSIKYHEIDTDKPLLNISSSHSGKNASLNMAAIGAANSLTWEHDEETEEQWCNTGITFNNKVTAADYFVNLEGTKTLEGRPLQNNEFEFVVIDADDPDEKVVATAKNDTAGHIHFSSIPYKAEDFEENHTQEFHYKMREKRPAGATAENNYFYNDIQYDPTEIPVTVTVTYNPDADVDAGEKIFDSEIVYPQDGAEFKNKYSATITTELKAQKTISGKRNEFKAGDSWTFTVTAADQDDPDNTNIPMPQQTEITIEPQAGTTIANVDFGTILYTEDDVGHTYVYTVQETGEVSGVTNDTAQQISISISKNTDGTLSLTRTPDTQTLPFVNFDEGLTNISVEKIWVNSAGEPVEHTTGSATVQLIAVKTEVQPTQPPQPTTSNLNVSIAWAGNTVPSDAEIVVSNGTDSITLSSANLYHGVFENLTVGETYTLTATLSSGEHITISNPTESVEIESGTNTATFNCSYDLPATTRDLTVTINWSGDAPGDNVSITATTQDGKTTTLNSANNWTGTIHDLTIGNSYQITLTAPAGVRYAVNPDNIQIEDTNNNQLEFSATYTEQPVPYNLDLTVRINWTGNPVNVSIPFTVAASNGANVGGGTLSDLPWQESVRALHSGEQYTVTLGQPTGANAGNVTINTASPQTITLSTTNHEVTFNATYTEPQQETADLAVTVNWDNAPGDVGMTIRATNTANSNDYKEINLSSNNSTTWSGTISGLTVGATYSVAATNKWGNNANNADITDDPKSVTIASGSNTISLTGAYTEPQQPTKGTIPITITWDNEPSDVTVTVTATPNNWSGETKSINISGTGTVWSGEITGLQDGQNYQVTYSIGGTNASRASLSPISPQYINAGTGLALTGAYNPPVAGKCQVTVRVNNSTYQAELDHNSTYTIIVTKSNPDAPITFTSDDIAVEGYTVSVGEQTSAIITGTDGWWACNNVTFEKVSNGGFNRAIRYIATAGASDASNSNSRPTITFSDTAPTIDIDNDNFLTLSDIIGDLEPGDYTLVGDPVTLQHTSNDATDWRHEWTDLPEYYKDGDTVYQLTYYVIETSATGAVSNTYSPLNTETNTYTITNKEGSGSLKLEKEVVAPEGMTAPQSYKSVTDGETIGEGAIAAFVNNKDVGSLKLEKEVVAPEGMTAPQSYKFTVYGETDHLYYNAVGETSESEVEIEITPGTAITIENIPTQGYTVSEVVGTNNANINVAGYNVTVNGSGDTATVTKGETATAKITNSYERKVADVQIKKSFTGLDALPTGFKITASYTLEGEDEPTTVDLKIGDANMTGTGTASDPYIWTIEDLPTGTVVTFKESGYTTEEITEKYIITTEKKADTDDDFSNGTGATVTATENATHAGELKNTYERKLADVQIRKTFSGIDALPDGFTIKASYTLEGASQATEVELKIGDANMTGTGTSDDPYIWTIKDLPTGTVVTFEESGYTDEEIGARYNVITKKQADDEDSLTSGTTVSVTSTENTVRFAEMNNTYDLMTGSLKIKKNVTVNGFDTTTDLADGTYTFSIKGTKGQDEVQVEITITGGVSNEVQVDDLIADTYLVTEIASTNENVKILDEVIPVEVTPNNVTEIPTAEFTNVRVIPVPVSKVDIANGKELPGAKIQIIDETGKVVEEWISTDTPHIVEGLEPGKTYTLHEETAPNGYLLTADTTFTIGEDGKVSGTCPISTQGVLLVEDEMKMTSVAVKKVWDDDNNREGLRKASVKVNLLANGKKVDSVILSEQNHWIAIKQMRAEDDEGKEIVYSWEEPDPGTGYTMTSKKSDDGKLTTLTNTHGPEKTKVSVKKIWVDDGDHPESITVQLFADGKAEGGPVTLNAGNGWKHSWKDLNKYCRENGQSREIVYTVTETEVPEGYVMKVNGNAKKGFVITNTKETGSLVIAKKFDIQTPEPPTEEEAKTEIEVVKIWQDNDNKDGNRPKSITVHLFAGGEEIKTAKLTEANGWKRTFGDLPKFVNGTPIHYSITEDPVEWYTTEIHGFTIVNKYNPETTSISVQKFWDDENNKNHTRPHSVKMKLNNGMSVVLSEANNWTATISGLPTRINGKPAEYYWTEPEVIGYALERTDAKGSTTEFTNKLWERPEKPPKGKKPKSPGETWYTFEEYDTPLGVEIMINHVGDCFD